MREALAAARRTLRRNKRVRWRDVPEDDGEGDADGDGTARGGDGGFRMRAPPRPVSAPPLRPLPSRLLNDLLFLAFLFCTWLTVSRPSEAEGGPRSHVVKQAPWVQAVWAAPAPLRLPGGGVSAF